MDSVQFRVPVRLQGTPGDVISEIYSAEEALDFLLVWPQQRGPVYQRALSSCFAATVDVETSDEAQNAFRAFARLSGILAPDMMHGGTARNAAGGKKKTAAHA